MATTTVAMPKVKGGSFLIEPASAEGIFTPEDFTDEHRAIRKTTDEFWKNEVAPNVEAIQNHEPGVAVGVLRKSGQLGLTAVVIPEKFGGMEMDLASAMVVAEGISRDGSYSGWHGAHTGIGTLPILMFGTEAQKQQYLPKLATAETIAAYCLTEPHAGSDSLASKSRADLSEDGTHYVLNGQKMWITNGGAADLFTVFAKIGGEKFTAFLVERGYPGVSVGHEEKKLGIKGSSTVAVYFDNVKVPVENLLGEIGRGHIIAFNILNIGRLKLGPFAVGGCKQTMEICLKYAIDRKAFGKSIGEFGMIQHKLAEMAIRLYAAETMSYRVVGMIESHLEGWNWNQSDAAAVLLNAVEEFAAECSYVKVFASEVLDYVVDEGVQIHGGNGFSAEYPVERAYRDSRINRIFEGTNEINRILATGMLLKRAIKGQLGLVEAVKRLQGEIMAGPTMPTGDPDVEMDLVTNAKKAVLLVLGVAYQRFMTDLEQQQEVLAAITDMSMAAFAMESMLLRTRKMAAHGKGEVAADMTSVYLREGMEQIESSAKYALAACVEGDALRTNLAVLRRFVRMEPVNSVAIRQKIAKRLLAAGKYVV